MRCTAVVAVNHLCVYRFIGADVRQTARRGLFETAPTARGEMALAR